MRHRWRLTRLVQAGPRGFQGKPAGSRPIWLGCRQRKMCCRCILQSCAEHHVWCPPHPTSGCPVPPNIPKRGHQTVAEHNKSRPRLRDCMPCSWRSRTGVLKQACLRFWRARALRRAVAALLAAAVAHSLKLDSLVFGRFIPKCVQCTTNSFSPHSTVRDKPRSRNRRTDFQVGRV